MPKYYNKKTKKWEEGEKKSKFFKDRDVKKTIMSKEEMIADKAKKELAKNKGAGSNIVTTGGKDKPKASSPGSSKAGMSGKSGGSSSKDFLGAPQKKFNVGVSKGGVSFKEAFSHFRKKGDKTFTWNGKKYTTELKK